MVPFSACCAFLLPFLELVVEPTLHAPEVEAVSFSVLFFIMYCITYLFYSVVFLILLWVLQRTSFYGDFRHAERRGYCWAVFSHLCTDTVASWTGA